MNNETLKKRNESVKQTMNFFETWMPELLSVFLFTIYQIFILFSSMETIAEMQILVYCMSVLLTTFFWIIGICFTKQKIRKLNNMADYALVLLFVISLASLFYKIFTNIVDWKLELILIAMIISYYVYSCRVSFHFNLINMLLITDILIYIFFFLLFFLNIFYSDLKIKLPDESIWAPYLLVTVSCSAIMYCINEKKSKIRFFYLGMTLAGFLLVLLLQHMTLICLVTLIILAIPVVYKPNKVLLGRCWQLLFIWIIFVCNMRILSELLGIEVKLELFSTGFNAVVEIISVAGGIICLLFWDNMPEQEKQVEYLRAMKRVSKGILLLYLLALFLLLIVGEGQGFAADEKSWLNLPVLSKQWVECRVKSDNLFLQFYQAWGVAGLVGAGIVLTLLLDKAMAKYKKFKKNLENWMPFLYMFTLIFIVQCFFWGLNAQTTPFFTLLITTELFRKSKTEQQNLNMKAG